MEKVIYLEPDDEITSVIDKIKKVNQDKVILVVPKAATILQSVVNLKILKNQAIRLGKEISIVTSDETGRNLAGQIGLTVYRDLAKRPVSSHGERPLPEKEPTHPRVERPEEKPEPEEPVKKSKEMLDIRPSGVKFKPFKDEKRAGIGSETILEKSIRPVKDTKVVNSLKKLKIAVILLLFTTLLTGAAAYLLLPRARVELVLKAEKLDKSYEIKAQKDVLFNEETGTISANIYSIEKEMSQEFEATGTKEVGEKAKGTIILFNETGTDQPLVATTRFVSSANLVFRSTAATTVPKAYLDPGGDKVNGTASVSVIADATGEKYNLGPSNFTIPGLAASIQSKVYGRSSAAMSGGSTRIIKIISGTDAKKAQAQLMAELVNSGRQEALSQADQGEEMSFEGSGQGAVISEDSSPAVGAEASSFKYSLKAQIKVMTVKKSDFYNLLALKINQEIPQDKELLKEELEKTTENKIVSIDTALGLMNVSSRVQAPVIAKMDLGAMKNNLKGKEASGAAAYLKAFEEIADAQVSLWPFFAKKVPSPKRIFINTSYQL
ncbi:baseplate J/gp47 family protein [Patescibacteria group bacterium]|nr:baseplate J/gp47 family protein [Patescibacteria group bacterium]